MPGIVGIQTMMPREWAEPQLLRMVDALRHEPYYITGTWMDDSLGLYIGWALQKDSFAAAMPLRNEDADVTLIFSGEDYPEPGTIARLKQTGHQFDPAGPAYLAHLAEEDPSFPARLNGRFQGVLVNGALGTATIFNDRYGMHRVYYHQAKEAFYLAAEAKAILAVRPELRETDPRGLGEFIACGCVLENRTLFKGVHVLPPASAWVLQNGEVHPKAYFEPREWEEQTTLGPESYYRDLKEIFARNLPRYFSGAQPISMSLTGGLDSRMIMAWAKAAPGALPCFSFGGTYRDCHDVRVGRAVARACGQPHQVIEVGQDFLSRFGHYAERTVYLTDGCADVGRSPDLFVNERARTIAPVRMTGNYGGEVLRRVRAFKPVPPAAGLFRPEMLGHVAAAGETYARLIRVHPLSFAVFRQAPWHHYGLLALEQTQLSLRSPYLDNDFVRMVFRAPDSACLDNDVCLRLIADGSPELAKIATDRGLGGNGNRLSAAIKRQMLEFTFKAEYAYDYGMPQSVARVDHIFAGLHLERLFLGRHKFNHFRVWYRDALAAYLQETLLDPRSLSRPYLDGKLLESMVRGHIKGDQNHTTAIHKVLTLELMHRAFIDGDWRCAENEHARVPIATGAHD